MRPTTRKPVSYLLVAMIVAASLRSGAALADGAPAPVVLSTEATGFFLIIHGTNFGVKKTPSVFLGGGAVGVLTWSTTTIVAVEPQGLPPASYLLLVVTDGFPSPWWWP